MTSTSHADVVPLWPRKLLILMYHHVGRPGPDVKYRGLYVTPYWLETHVRVLSAAGYRFATLADALSGAFAGQKVACLTFDDGYVDNLTLGLPRLARLGVPATLFVVTGDVGRRGVRWAEAGETSRHDLLDWDQLGRLREGGWEIGSHAHDHVHFGRRGLAEQEDLLHASHEAIQAGVGVAPSSFAFPYGSFNEDSFTALARSPFARAVTTVDGVNAPGADAWRLRRVAPKGHSWRHVAPALRLARFA